MREFLKLLQPIQRKIQQVVSRGVVRLVDDALKMQGMQLTLMADETLDGVERFQNYGYTSVPLPGAEAITLSVNGHRSHSVVIVVDDKRYRLKGLAGGEVALYDDQGQKIHLKRDKILIETPLDFELRAKNIKLHATDSYSFDVDGQGQRWDSEGVETWQDDDITKPHHNHAPPEIPDD
ncbi:MAG: phage baseplate assembly protein [Gammaproteobacteria bacterium]|nr:phage baseplate assembly protein [Gammaproteobacteria bacterium]